MLIFINVPEWSKEFTNLKPIEGDNSVLKIKKKSKQYYLNVPSILKINFIIIFIHYLRLTIVSL